MSRKRSTIRRLAWLTGVLVAAGIGFATWEFATTGDLPNMLTLVGLACTLFGLVLFYATIGSRVMRSEEVD